MLSTQTIATKAALRTVLGQWRAGDAVALGRTLDDVRQGVLGVNRALVPKLGLGL